MYFQGTLGKHQIGSFQGLVLAKFWWFIDNLYTFEEKQTPTINKIYILDYYKLVIQDFETANLPSMLH